MKGKIIKRKAENKLNSDENHLKLVPKGGDHYEYDLFYKGVQVGFFQISRGSKEFGKKLVGRMARQIGVSSIQLQGIEKCTFWASDFIKHSKLITN